MNTFFHFANYIYMVIHSLFFERKSPINEIIIFFGWPKTNHNCLQHERVLKIFLLSYFDYCQDWLNILMDDHQLSNITKLK
jgi:hypothetical protein